MPIKFTDHCVYTIKHSNDLGVTSNKGCPFPEGHSWRTAQSLLDEAEINGARLPIIFAPAENTRYLYAWALLDSIDPRPEGGIEYTFSKLKLFKAHTPPDTDGGWVGVFADIAQRFLPNAIQAQRDVIPDPSRGMVPCTETGMRVADILGVLQGAGDTANPTAYGSPNRSSRPKRKKNSAVDA